MTNILSYSKSLELSDYDDLKSELLAYNTACTLLNGTYSSQHTHRAWEYSLCLKLLRENKIKSILDVGGAGSPFAGMCVLDGISVQIIDPSSFRENYNKQIQYLNRNMIKYEQTDIFNYPNKQKFLGVTCISVLEHVENDLAFFEHLLTYVESGGIIFFSFDFSTTGQSFWENKSHLRTYNFKTLNKFIKKAYSRGFRLYGNLADYSSKESNVYQYNFASLALKRIDYANI